MFAVESTSRASESEVMDLQNHFPEHIARFHAAMGVAASACGESAMAVKLFPSRYHK